MQDVLLSAMNNFNLKGNNIAVLKIGTAIFYVIERWIIMSNQNNNQNKSNQNTENKNNQNSENKKNQQAENKNNQNSQNKKNESYND